MKLGAKNLVLVKAKKGFIMCGYLNLSACNKFNDAAAVVKGVSTVAALLKAPLVSVSKKARTLGVRKGMPAKQALLYLS